MTSRAESTEVTPRSKRHCGLLLVLAILLAPVVALSEEQPEKRSAVEKETQEDNARGADAVDDGAPRPLFRRPASTAKRRWGSLLIRGPLNENTKRLREEVVTGLLSFAPGKSLVLQDPEKQEVVNVSTTRIESVEVFVEKESIEQEWRWREQGSDEKIFTGRTYPDRTYCFSVKLDDGRTHKGRFLGFPVYITKEDGKTQRYVVRPRQRGEAGQKSSDLVYVAGLAFHEKGTPPPWKIEVEKEVEEGKAGGRTSEKQILREEGEDRRQPPSVGASEADGEKR